MKTWFVLSCTLVAASCAPSSDNASSASPGTASGSEASHAPSDDNASARIVAGITRTSETERAISLDAARALAEGPGGLGSARFESHTAAGTVDGVQVFGVTADDVLGSLGFLNGDVLAAVNDGAVSTPDAARAAFTHLADQDTVRFRLVRRGQPLELTVRRGAP